MNKKQLVPLQHDICAYRFVCKKMDKPGCHPMAKNDKEILDGWMECAFWEDKNKRHYDKKHK